MNQDQFRRQIIINWYQTVDILGLLDCDIVDGGSWKKVLVGIPVTMEVDDCIKVSSLQAPENKKENAFYRNFVMQS